MGSAPISTLDGSDTGLNGAQDVPQGPRFVRVDGSRLSAEQRARVLIDRQLTDAGWSVQDRNDMNLFAGSSGIAVREAIMAEGHGRADYLLYVEQKTVGVIEAKPE